MRGSRWFIIGIVLFLLIMFVVEYHLPKKFVWNPTFGQHDHQPLGGAVFDDVLKSSLPDGYSLSRRTFYQFAADSSPGKSILVVTQHLDLVKADVSALLDLARRGNKILIASSSFSPLLADTLGFNNSYAYFNPRRLKEYAADLLERDSVFWIGDSAVYDKRTFRFYPHLCGIYFTKYDSLSCRWLRAGSIPCRCSMTVYRIAFRLWLSAVRSGGERLSWSLRLCCSLTMGCSMAIMQPIFSVCFHI